MLSAHIKVVKEAKLDVIWSCDPCHGNTEVAENGYKTRDFENVSTYLK